MRLRNASELSLHSPRLHNTVLRHSIHVRLIVFALPSAHLSDRNTPPEPSQSSICTSLNHVPSRNPESVACYFKSFKTTKAPKKADAWVQVSNVVVAQVHNLQALDHFWFQIHDVVVARQEDIQARESLLKICRERVKTVHSNIDLLQAWRMQELRERFETSDVVRCQVKFPQCRTSAGATNLCIAQNIRKSILRFRLLIRRWRFQASRKNNLELLGSDGKELLVTQGVSA
ncbi:hypothetical protein HG530_002671 [Fusarium avenaceum]|nr:hypothetical protein HG530_002671 [Fusarium avenaceum]